jgi:myo-inositol-1(or 4)-monophosphatase
MRTQKLLNLAPAGLEVDLERARAVAVEAVEQAGALVLAGAALGDTGLGGSGRGVPARTKDATGDVVTKLDLDAENLIVGRLRRAFPQHRILSEESGLFEASDHSWVWLVDPLDGTNNIAIGLSNYVVGIALCRDGVPVLGVVHDPVRGATWSAATGTGTTGPDGKAVRPPHRRATHGPVLAWAQGYRVGRDDAAAQALRLVLETRSRRVLQLWAPLLAWVMLARGDIHGYVGLRAERVDLPAGSLIAREAGIVVRGFDGRPFDERIDAGHDRNFVAGPPHIIPELLAMVRAAGKVRITGLTP